MAPSRLDHWLVIIGRFLECPRHSLTGCPDGGRNAQKVILEFACWLTGGVDHLNHYQRLVACNLFSVERAPIVFVDLGRTGIKQIPLLAVALDQDTADFCVLLFLHFGDGYRRWLLDDALGYTQAVPGPN